MSQDSKRVTLKASVVRRRFHRFPGLTGAAMLAAALLPLAACGTDSPTAALIETPEAPVITALEVASVAATQATVVWSIDHPALSLVEYGTTEAYGQSATAGTSPDTSHEVVLDDLEPATTYHLRVTAQDGPGKKSTTRTGQFKTAEAVDTVSPVDSTTVPVDSAAVPADSTATPADEPSILPVWMGQSEVAELPTSGSAWNNVRAQASGSCGSVRLDDQEDMTNVCVMAKALVFARTGEEGQRDDVVRAIGQIVSAATYQGRALALGRELIAYVIAADMIDLREHDPVLDLAFRAKLAALRTTYTSGAARNLIECHEKRPNNWGAHCGATRMAIAVYLGDMKDLDRAAQVFKGYIGDRSAYRGFEYGEDLSWQCDPERPVGINPAGCERNGVSLDGALPDDQRRAGRFTTSPPKENYVWEALQGLLAQAIILDRAGYDDVWEWEDRALLRALDWLHDVADFPAEGDDTWQPHVINRQYGSSFPAPVPALPGKNVGWTDWSHRN